MKITPELLNRYLSNQCSEQEADQVRQWIASTENESSDLKAYEEKRLENQVWRRLSDEINGKSSIPMIPLYKRVTRYAAVACIVLAAFFGGRFSANKAKAKDIVAEGPKNQLYITGGQGARGNLPGSVYKVSFDGTIRLFNSSEQQKFIQVGDRSFVLEPFNEYYLSGSVHKPFLQNNSEMQNEQFDETYLEGDFSVLIVRK